MTDFFKKINIACQFKNDVTKKHLTRLWKPEYQS